MIAVWLCEVMCGESDVAINLDLDPDLLDRAHRIGGERSKKATVTRALEEFIARRDRRRLLDLAGTLEWDPDVDTRAERDR